jgi:hypothetical protein
LELEQILNLKMKKDDLAATPEALIVALEVLNRARVRPNFGNAGEAENMLGRAKQRYQSRLPGRSEVVFEPEDFDPDHGRSRNALQNLSTLFQDMLGSEPIVNKIRGYLLSAEAMRNEAVILVLSFPQILCSKALLVRTYQSLGPESPVQFSPHRHGKD